MKPNLALFLLPLLLTSGLDVQASSHAQNQTESKEQSEAPSPAVTLADQVQEIASSSTLSRKSQAKLITNAVRLAITTVLEGIKDPAEQLKIALELATTAAKAAPHFATAIISAVSSLPVIAQIDGARDQIKSAVKAGIEASEETELANPAVNPPRPTHHEFDGPNKGETVVSPSH